MFNTTALDRLGKAMESLTLDGDDETTKVEDTPKTEDKEPKSEDDPKEDESEDETPTEGDDDVVIDEDDEDAEEEGTSAEDVDDEDVVDDTPDEEKSVETLNAEAIALTRLYASIEAHGLDQSMLAVFPRQKLLSSVTFLNAVTVSNESYGVDSGETALALEGIIDTIKEKAALISEKVKGWLSSAGERIKEIGATISPYIPEFVKTAAGWAWTGVKVAFKYVILPYAALVAVFATMGAVVAALGAVGALAVPAASARGLAAIAQKVNGIKMPKMPGNPGEAKSILDLGYTKDKLMNLANKMQTEFPRFTQGVSDALGKISTWFGKMRDAIAKSDSKSVVYLRKAVTAVKTAVTGILAGMKAGILKHALNFNMLLASLSKRFLGANAPLTRKLMRASVAARRRVADSISSGVFKTDKAFRGASAGRYTASDVRLGRQVWRNVSRARS